MNIKKNRKIYIIIGASLLILLLGIRFYPKYVISTYDRVTLQRGDIKETVSATGKINAENKVDLSFESTGKIAYFPFTDNDLVNANSIVATLDPQILLHEIAKAQSAVEGATDALDEYTDLNREDLKEPEIINAKDQLSEVLVQRYEDLKIAQRNKINAVLIAPFDGVVTQANGEVNEWVSSLSPKPLIQIVDFGSLYFEAEVDEEDSIGIEEGQRASVSLDALNGQVVEGRVLKVFRFTRVTDDNNIVVPVWIQLDGNSNKLKLGWEGNTQIELNKKENVLLLPKRALKREGEKTYVFVLENNRPTKRIIDTGLFDGSYWEVREGLNEFDKVIIKND